MSNTEKLAGIIIKILKVVGILFIILLIIDFISLILFAVIKKESNTSISEEATLNCSLNNEDYTITLDSKAILTVPIAVKKFKIT